VAYVGVFEVGETDHTTGNSTRRTCKGRELGAGRIKRVGVARDGIFMVEEADHTAGDGTPGADQGAASAGDTCVPPGHFALAIGGHCLISNGVGVLRLNDGTRGGNTGGSVGPLWRPGTLHRSNKVVSNKVGSVDTMHQRR
jgi:hypothetical protein